VFVNRHDENHRHRIIKIVEESYTFVISKTKKMKGNLLVCCLIFFTALFADLNGKWTGVITTPDGNDLPVTYNFKVVGDSLTGTAESPSGAITIDNGKVYADSFSFKVTVEGNDYPHKGKIYGDSCRIDIDFGGVIVHSTLTRARDK
jgi:hypothetical protein